MKIIEKTKFGTYTLEEAKNGNYVIKCEDRIVRRHGEFPTSAKLSVNYFTTAATGRS